MFVTRLQLTNFRNFSQLQFEPSPSVNFFYGANASGKTSILEAIYLLGLARSFRSTRLNNLVSYQANSFNLFAKFSSSTNSQLNLGLQKNRQDKKLLVNFNGSKPSNLAEISTLIPLQLINPDVFQLLDGSPNERRKFLDWGVFYFDQNFFLNWQRFAKALKQRNALLRNKAYNSLEIAAWEQELSTTGTSITTKRKQYLQLLSPAFEYYLAKFGAELDLTLSFSQGWDKSTDLSDYLAANRARDAEQGFTQYGPQRADIKIYAAKYLAKDVLSRGQQKLVVSALKLAQAKVMQEELNKACIFLIDDLAAELDLTHQKTFCTLLTQLSNQIFITSVDKSLANHFSIIKNFKSFHVEPGLLTSGKSAD